ncbi:hypothetical protein BGZ83_002566 [Gryganskiella cystojenkinii]|nr:hypothetical protein BGZ83_002566 [Gryganskiella cystojenkinii]
MLSVVTVFARPPPPSSPLLQVLEPHTGETYKVGQQVHVKVKFVGGTKNALYKDNTNIQFAIQKAIPLPDLNEDLGSISARQLYKDGFKFKVLSKYLIKEQATIPFRVRAHFDGPHAGYDDSSSFKLVKK